MNKCLIKSILKGAPQARPGALHLTAPIESFSTSADFGPDGAGG